MDLHSHVFEQLKAITYYTDGVLKFALIQISYQYLMTKLRETIQGDKEV